MHLRAYGSVCVIRRGNGSPSNTSTMFRKGKAEGKMKRKWELEMEEDEGGGGSSDEEVRTVLVSLVEHRMCGVCVHDWVVCSLITSIVDHNRLD